MSVFLSPFEKQKPATNLNLDELFEKRRALHQKQVALYNAVLNRIHERIRTVARQPNEVQYIKYDVPRFIVGAPAYKINDCIAYLISKLEGENLQVWFSSPNTLYVSWANYVPTYERMEIERKTGIVLDERGNVLRTPSIEPTPEQEGETATVHANGRVTRQKKEYTPLTQFRPTRAFTYSDSMFDAPALRFPTENGKPMVRW